jgi:uncharacterized protein (TIGR03067 family)
MSCLHCVMALLPLAVSAGPEASQPTVYTEQPRRFITIERPGLPSVVLLGSEEILARDDLVGTWQVVELEHQGEPRPDLAAGLQMQFSRGKLELLQTGRPTITVAYDLDLKTYPPRLTWVHRLPCHIAIQKGVYWVDGDTLIICLAPINTRRATEFLTQPYDGRTMFTLERLEPAAEGAVSAEQWMSLGVFGLKRADQPTPSLLVRLAVDRHGAVAGEAYDLVGKAKQPLRGSVDKKTAQIRWSVGTEKPIVMEASVDGLMQAETPVVLRDAEGRSETWTMTYLFEPSAEGTTNP